MSDFRELVRSLNPVLGRLMVTGAVETLDQYSRANTISGNAAWMKRKGRCGISPVTTGNIAGDTLSELMYIPMGGTLLPTDVPGLED